MRWRRIWFPSFDLMAIESPVTGFSRREQGFEVIGLRNDDLEISLVPKLGAKIISLINRRPFTHQ